MTEKDVELFHPEKQIEVQREIWANPATLGLMGFALTTMATGLHNVGYWGAGPTLAMALAFGGTAQFFAGAIAFRKGAMFPGTAFCSYGAFWWSLFFMLFVLPMGGVKIDAAQEFGFFLMWTLFTLPFVIASIKHGKLLFILFVLLEIAFLMLDGVTLGVLSAVPTGWEIFITGLLAWYIGAADLVNHDFGREVLPNP